MSSGFLTSFMSLVLFLSIVLPIESKATDFDPFKNPDQFVASFLRDNRSKINELTETCLDASKSTNDRKQSLQDLHNLLPDVALPVLARLIEDEDSEVAALAAVMLSSSSMMMNHKMPEGAAGEHNENPFVEFAMQRHDLIYSSLRKALKDKRAEVNAPIAAALSSQSDELGVALIANDSDTFSDSEVVRYLSLASPEVAGEYLTKYLDSTDAALLDPASRYLAESSRYKDLVTDKVLLNRSVPIDSRIEAAKFLPYSELLPLFISSETPEKLYSAALESYVKQSGETLSKPQIEHLLEGIERYGPDSNVQLKNLKGRLDQLNQNIDSDK